MNKIKRMGRKPLGKKTYQFTCPPDLLKQFDKLASKQGLTRSDLIATLIREHVERNASRKP